MKIILNKEEDIFEKLKDLYQAYLQCEEEQREVKINCNIKVFNKLQSSQLQTFESPNMEIIQLYLTRKMNKIKEEIKEVMRQLEVIK